MYRRTWSLGLCSLLLAVVACKDDSQPEVAPPPAISACLEQLEDGARARLAIRECQALCQAEDPDPVACGGMALAHMQSLGAQIANYTVFLRPSQTPEEAMSTLGQELGLDFRTANTDLGSMLDIFLAPMVTDLRGIREGVHGFIDADIDAEVPLGKLPLAPGLLAFMYSNPDSFAIQGSWSAKEMATLGAVANGLLAAIDMVYSHNLRLNIPSEFPTDNIATILDTSIRVLDQSPLFLTLGDESVLLDARDELDAMFSLLAGRTESKENVAQGNPGLLEMISAQMERDGRTATGRTPVLLIRDIDGDGRLSRGDALRLTLLVNGQEVDLAFPYPISAVLTEVVFDFLGQSRDNMDGDETPLRIAPVINSAFKEFSGVFGGLGGVPTIPDVIALDWYTFFETFGGVRGLLPYWYEDKATDSSVNPYYFDGITNEVQYYMAYEEQVGEDRPHFEWHDTVDDDFSWMEFDGTVFQTLAADGIEVDPVAYYILWQSPSFDGFLRTNTRPFITPFYGMAADLNTEGAYVWPDNREVNAVMNAFILWAQE